MTILLLGKDGQIGRALQQTLAPLGNLVALNHYQLDLERLSDIDDALHTYTPKIIVNAAAYTAVDKAESNETLAFNVNAQSVGILANYAFAYNSLLIHYSTDYVFDGEKASPYIETDETCPQNIYGLSKRAGEEIIQQSSCNALIFRTSWVFSTHGHNFIKTILALAKDQESLEVIADQIGAPTSANLIANITAQTITQYREKKMPLGLYHLTASGKTNWYEFACYIIECAIKEGAKLKIKDTSQIRPISTEAYPLPATRPKNSQLNSSLLSSILKIQIPDWREHVNHTVSLLIKENWTSS